jgi:hypothetical protein
VQFPDAVVAFQSLGHRTPTPPPSKTEDGAPSFSSLRSDFTAMVSSHRRLPQREEEHENPGRATRPRLLFGVAGRVAHPSRSKMPWVAYPCGSGSCKGGTFFALLLSFSLSLLPLSVHGIDANQSWFILGVKRKTGRVPRSGSLEKFLGCPVLGL